MSMPSTRAAVSLSWMARNARPVGLSIRLTATQAPSVRLTPATQYQVCDPETRQSKTNSRGTGMPFGPPVHATSFAITMAVSRPMPSVATAR